MSDESTRRDFLRIMGVSSGALLVGATGCSGASSQSDNGSDAGGGDADRADSSGGGECEVTGSDIEGPFHLDDAPERTVLADEDEPGERLVIEGTVYGPDCETPLERALLDVWQADAEGDYHGGEEDDYRLRGQLVTDADGHYSFESIMPGNYPMGEGLMRPAHIHFTISYPDLPPLTTQMYFAGDPHLAEDDPCSTCNSGDSTLIVDLEEGEGDIDWRGSFDIVLDG